MCDSMSLADASTRRSRFTTRGSSTFFTPLLPGRATYEYYMDVPWARRKVVVTISHLLYKIYNATYLCCLAGASGIHLYDRIRARYANPLNISQTV